MKTEKYKCPCCDRETKKYRPIAIVNLKNYTLCNACNYQLIARNVLRITEDFVLRVTGKRGDFLKIEACREVSKETFWERRARVKELAAMSNQSMVGWDVHESY